MDRSKRNGSSRNFQPLVRLSWSLVSLVILLLWLAACSTPSPTFTPLPSVTDFAILEPTSTATPPPPRPSSTPAPSITPTPQPTPSPTPLLFALAETPLPGELESISLESALLVSALAEWQQDSLKDLAWAPDGLTLAAAGDQGISLYDIHTRRLLRRLESEPGLTSIAYSPRSDFIAAGNLFTTTLGHYGGNVDLWRVTEWELIDFMYSDTRPVSEVAFSPTGDLFATAFANQTNTGNSVYIWNTNTFEITRTLTTGTVLGAIFSPDGKLLATTPDQYAIKIWQIKDGKLLLNLRTSFTGAVNSLDFSPDGKTLASGHYDGFIRIWDTGKGTLLSAWQTEGVVESLAFSPDSMLLATGSSFNNFTIRLWDPASGQLLRTLEGHPRGVDSLEFSPDGTLLVSGSYDGLLRLWGVRP